MTLLGATVSKVEMLHRRRLNDDDIRVGIVRAILRAQEYLTSRNAGETLPQEESVMIRDTDLAELADSTTTRVNHVP